MKTILGIDFGTTTTTIAMTSETSRFEPELIEIDAGQDGWSVMQIYELLVEGIRRKEG